MKTAKQINIGLIGCGSMGQIHLKCLYFLKKYAHVKGVYDKNEHLAHTVAVQYGIHQYRDVEEMLNDKQLDAVYICTPHNTHAPLTLAALERDKHVFCEKPLGLNCDDIKKIIEVSSQKSKIVAVGYNHRFTPAVQEAIKFIDKMHMSIHFATIHFECAKFLEGWPADPVFGGGIAYCIGSHAVDLLLYLVRRKVTWISGVLGWLRLSEPCAPDTGIAILGLEGGGYANIIIHDHMPRLYSVQAKQMVRINLIAKEGLLVIETINGVVEWWPKENSKPQKFKYEKRNILYDWGYIAENLEFLKVLHNYLLDTKIATPYDALNVCIIIKAFEQSAKNGTVVHLNQNFCK